MSESSNRSHRNLGAIGAALAVFGIGVGIGIGIGVGASMQHASHSDSDSDQPRGRDGVTVPSGNEEQSQWSQQARSERARAAREFAMPGSAGSLASPAGMGAAAAPPARMVDPNPPPLHAEPGPAPASVRPTNPSATSDAGIGASAVWVTPPAILAEARSTIDGAFARRTLSNTDRARLLTLLPSMAEADRVVLATRVFEGATSGALAIESARPSPATDVPTPR